ncbi:MAG: hypothetical protein EOP14_06025 [Pseudomonas sp.]|nr:MAG: hypothetical protein EOP14_06025 [Pseudomonas sp.]
MPEPQSLPTLEVLDQSAIDIGPVGQATGASSHLGGSPNARPGPDQRTEGSGGKATVADHPTRNTRQAVDQPWRHYQFVCPARGHGEGHCPAVALGDHAGLGAIAAA